jgi:dipeptidyl aminopeptidase/acylaminoacyl peptidase
MTFRFFIVLLLIATGSGKSIAGPSSEAVFQVSDYLRIARVSELALSAGGDRLAYTLETASLAQDKISYGTHLMTLPARGKPSSIAASIAALSDAHALAWIGDKSELAFLSARGGSTQVFVYDAQDGSVRQVTHSDHSVAKFLYSASGDRLAYSTTAVSEPIRPVLDQLRNSDRGVLIDAEKTSLYDFVNPDWRQEDASQSDLWIADAGRPDMKVEIPGQVTEFHWSADGKRLSVTYRDDGNSSLLRYLLTSIGVVEIATLKFSPIARGYSDAGGSGGKGYAGGEWLPDNKRLIIRRVMVHDPWASVAFQDWAVASASRGLSDADLSWHFIEVYPGGSKFVPVTDSMILVENTVEGVRSLFVLDTHGIRRSSIVDDLEGSSSRFAWSADFKRVAFVNESLTSAPEIYVAVAGGKPFPVTKLNEELSKKRGFAAKKVTWHSTDGTLVTGWLLEPANADSNRRLPLVVFVHGGPCYAFTNAFAPYFSLWPYPLETYASYGIAVLVPNYRGTCGFGRQFNSPAAIDREPVDDIISGVQLLIKSGRVDIERLGISGHSHGAWLGPSVMTRSKLFRTGSFAEGTSNYLLSYELMPAQLNREVHDVINGASLYDTPARYIELSPDLHFDNLVTATLFESGALSGPLLMLGMAKAAHRYGLPAENVVYPRTGHNIDSLRIQKESAERNLDWFRFWLQDEEDADPAKGAQYERWRSLRAVARKREATLSPSPAASVK